MKTLNLLPAATLAITLGLGLLPAQAASSGSGAGTSSNYAALAVGEHSRAFGFSVNQPSRKAAEKVALRECRKHARDCKIETWTTQCLAFARAKGGAWGTAWRETKFKARNEAMKGCRKHSRSCKIEVSVCNRGA